MKLHKLMLLPAHRSVPLLLGCMTLLAALLDIVGGGDGRTGWTGQSAVLAISLAMIAWSLIGRAPWQAQTSAYGRLVPLLLVTLFVVAVAAYDPLSLGLTWLPLLFLPVAGSLLANGKAYAYYALFYLAFFSFYLYAPWSDAGPAAADAALSGAWRMLAAAGSVLLGAVVLASRRHLAAQMEARALRQHKRQIINMLQCFIPVGERKTQTSRREISEMSALMKSLWSECGGTGAKDWEIELLSLLHFVSRVKLPDYMFEKAEKLSAFELEVVKEHCYMAKELCEGVPGFGEIQEAFLYHHEKVDGTGYPYRLKEDRIPLLSQMLGMAEVFLALTTARSYRQAMSEEAACEEIRKLAGTSFRQDLVDALERVLERAAAAS